MAFDSIEHLEDNEYYEYLYRKADEMGLPLDDDDYDTVVKRYQEELALEADEFQENDALLLKIVKELFEEKAKELPEKDDSYLDSMISDRTAYERNRFNKGGHGFGDSYDDQGLDELEQEGPSL